MNIAIIEDSKTISHLVSSTLKIYGYVTHIFESDQLDELDFNIKSFDVLILNTKLQNIDTKYFIRDLRKVSSSIYIVGINTNGAWENQIELLNIGVDDILSYPFPMQELLARVQALLRRPRNSEQLEYKIKDIVIDPISKTITQKKKAIKLRKKEYSLLEYLARNKNRPISRTELLDNVWDYRRFTDSNTIDVHISNIRRVFEDKSFISTIHGFGYQLNDSDDVKYQREESKEVSVPPEL